MLCGLAYLESLNIAHRDVRSDNLLLSRNGTLKLGKLQFLHLSMTIVTKRDARPADFSQAVITEKDTLLLSIVPVPPYWMAPEMRL